MPTTVCRDRPLPLRTECDPQQWIQYYLDDFDAAEIVHVSDSGKLLGTLSAAMGRQRDAYTANGVPWAADKACLREPLVERMGALVDGGWGRVSAPLLKAYELVHFGLWILSLPFRRQDYSYVSWAFIKNLRVPPTSVFYS